MRQMRIQHVALSVSDIGKSGPWYSDLFGFDKVAEFADPPMEIYMTPDGQALDLRQDANVVPGRFDEKRVGLDHLAFVCLSAGEMDEWLARMAELGVDNSGVVESPFGKHISFRDPDGIALEFFLPASSA
jgi:catechol 2,3-dioxygenase-like lactoylglutathione lyase family enzyme